MRTLILGGTGLIGTRLKNALLERGDEVVITTRNPKHYQNTQQLIYAEWIDYNSGQLAKILNEVDNIVNLQGENIGQGRWTKEKRSLILQSRVSAGQALCKALRLVDKMPSLLIQGSATGFYQSYSSIETSPLCTEACPNGTNFLATVCRNWENSTQELENLGIRRCIIRTAPVLGRGGMQDKIIPIFNHYLGGVFGSGAQPFSWIHINDHVAAMLFLMDNPQLKGIFNLCAPHPVSMRDFSNCLGHILNKAVYLPYPSFIMRLVLGQMAEEMLLSGQNIYPEALLANHFAFKYPYLENALQAD